VQIIGESHLRLLRPDLERYVHSTRFALTGSDVVHDSLRATGPRYVMQLPGSDIARKLDSCA
jgi:hypothetical protein